jgi:ABC-type multidrug transport system fused ATPase/permease subunit
MEAIWISYKQQGKPLNLYWLAYLTLPGQVKAVFVSLFFDAGLRLLYSFFMGATIRCLGDYFYARKAENVSEEQLEELRFAAVVYTALMILVILSYIYAERLYFAISFQSGMKLRLIFTSLLYRKLHRISLSALNEVSLGRFINIMSSDLSLLEPGLHQFSIVCIAPFMLFVGLALMWRYNHRQ